MNVELQISGLSEMIDKYNQAERSVDDIVSTAMEHMRNRITVDTRNAIKKENLPNRGKYSKGRTLESLIKEAEVVWQGTEATVRVGFDLSKGGAGQYLITGTPKIQPVKKLNQMYKGKTYMKNQNKIMTEEIIKQLAEEIE